MMSVAKTMAGFAVVLMIGCTGPTEPMDSDEMPEAEKADSSMPYGIWVAESPRIGELAKLTILSDHSYTRIFQTVDCIGCDETGKVKFTASSKAHYIRFYDTDGTFIDRMAWKMAKNVLTLTDSDGNTYKMDRRGGVGSSCGGFVINPVQCDDGLNCVYTGVPDVPGTCQDPSKKNACQKAGGSCVALAPGTCDSGAVGDATQYSCGGGLGIECCLPTK
jgi:hypothetical protein